MGWFARLVRLGFVYCGGGLGIVGGVMWFRLVVWR